MNAAVKTTHEHHQPNCLPVCRQLKFEDIPAPVVRRAEDLLVDWFGSALAGKGARPVESHHPLCRRHGPGLVRARPEVLIHAPQPAAPTWPPW
jgi:2-methylcitrate dehydratase PrpD